MRRPPPQYQPVTAPPTGTAISIAPPSSRNQPVPVPPTGTAISIAPPLLRTSLYRPYQRAPQYLLSRPPLQCQPVPVLSAGTAAPIAPPHPQYRPAATSSTAAQTRLPAFSREYTPTAGVPKVVYHNNPLPQPSLFQPTQPSLPPVPNNANVRLGSAQQVATRTRVNRAPSAPIDMSIVNTTSRLHQRRHTRPYQIPLKMLARTIPQESLTPLTRPTLLTPPATPDLPSTLTTRTRVGLLVQTVGFGFGQEGAGTLSPSTTPASLLDTRHCAMPAIAEISADLANLVGDTPAAANSRIHSLPNSTATTPGPSTPASFFRLRPNNPFSARPPASADPAE